VGVALAGRTARAYDPWSDRWSPAAVDKSSVVLPEFRRSVIVRIE
jgi:hypothetical protein